MNKCIYEDSFCLKKAAAVNNDIRESVDGQQCKLKIFVMKTNFALGGQLAKTNKTIQITGKY